ncbi:hypothetical protein ACMHYB_22615 [Sorangium sp. So ce1128]
MAIRWHRRRRWRASRAYPANCTADIPYSYSSVLISDANDVKDLVPEGAGVGKL